MSGVKLKKISKSYGPLEVVHGIDLEVASQEFVVLVGPSGCGKSTTLRMVAGLEEITSGELMIDDKVVNEVAPKDRDIAMVFQNYALYPHLNVADNIAFGLKIRKESKENIEKQVAEVSEILGLTEYLERRPADLSGGQRQRVAMGRAIVRHPKVFLFDEPLSNLDAKLRTQMRAEIKRLHKRLGVTSLYVTHDQVEAMTLADRIIVMQDGNIEQVGTPMELFKNPKNIFVASFMGSPPMNLLDGVIEIKDDKLHARVGKKLIELRDSKELGTDCSGRKIVIGIRPEHTLIEKPEEPSTAVPIELDLVETLGSEALLHAQLDGELFVTKVETLGQIEHLNEVDTLYFRPNMMKVFDKETGLAFDHPNKT